MSDMKQGLITAPVLFAAQEHPELIKIMKRQFSEDGDPEKVWCFAFRSDFFCSVLVV